MYTQSTGPEPEKGRPYFLTEDRLQYHKQVFDQMVGEGYDREAAMRVIDSKVYDEVIGPNTSRSGSFTYNSSSHRSSRKPRRSETHSGSTSTNSGSASTRSASASCSGANPNPDSQTRYETLHPFAKKLRDLKPSLSNVDAQKCYESMKQIYDTYRDVDRLTKQLAMIEFLKEKFGVDQRDAKESYILLAQ